MKLEAEARAAHAHGSTYQSQSLQQGNPWSSNSSEFNQPSFSTGLEIHIPESQKNPSSPQKEQQALFEERFILEAEERARRELYQQ